MVIQSPQSGLPRDDAQAPSGLNHTERPIFWMRLNASASTTQGIEAIPGASAKAIISEIEKCAAHFAATGESASIDLRFLKSMPGERETLARLLGRGEVSATIDVLGRSEVQETSVPCVWWIHHYNSEGETVGELIEIADIPDVIVGDRMAVAQGLEALRIAYSVQTASPHHNAR